MFAFCGNVVELVKKYKAFNDIDFVQWIVNDLEPHPTENASIELYIEKKMISELEKESLIIIALLFEM